MARKTPDPVDVYVGQRVRQARLLLPMSQEKLGAALDISFQQIQKYEKGANRISPSKLQRIAAALKRSPAWFFDGAPGADALVLTGDQRDPINDLGSLADGVHLAEAFIAIKKPETRRAILNIARAAAGFDELAAPA